MCRNSERPIGRFRALASTRWIALSSSGPSVRAGNPAAPKSRFSTGHSVPSLCGRRASSTQTRSSRSRGSANASTRAEARSSHCSSSIATSNGARPAKLRRTPSTARGRPGDRTAADPRPQRTMLRRVPDAEDRATRRGHRRAARRTGLRARRTRASNPARTGLWRSPPGRGDGRARAPLAIASTCRCPARPPTPPPRAHSRPARAAARSEHARIPVRRHSSADRRPCQPSPDSVGV